MISKEAFVDILAMYKQGKSLRQIAKETGHSRNTVRKYITDRSYPIYRRNKKRGSILDEFKQYIKERVEQAAPEWIPATVIFSEIKSKGYSGGISTLRAYLKHFKTKTIKEEVVRFETKPGEQLQIDFTTIKYSKYRFKAFVATLGYSRYCYVEFFDNEKASAWMQGIENSLKFFNGIPETILFDNAKALVVQRDAYGEGAHKFNNMLLDLSKKYGFRLKACKPYRAKTKGKVERFNSYLKHSFVIPLLSSLKNTSIDVDINLLNAKTKIWLKDIANKRIHGTTKRSPYMLFNEERAALGRYAEKHTEPNIATADCNSVYGDKAKEIHSTKELNHTIQHDIHVFDILLNTITGG